MTERLEELHSGITIDKPAPPRTEKKQSIALPSAEEDNPKNYWKMAFIAAVVGVSYPPIEAMAEKEGLFGFTFALGGVICAVAASVASFSKKESQKYWTLIAVALSFLPFVIY